MKMHFICTGMSFPFSYYIGLMSAAKVGTVKLWYIKKPNSIYFYRAYNSVETEQITAISFPKLNNRDPHFVRVCMFDYMIWKIISNEGGSVMGLDSITLKPFQHLIENHEIMVGRDSEINQESICMHGATAICGSKIARQIFKDSESNLNGNRVVGKYDPFINNQLKFGGAGIIPFKNNILNPVNVNKIKILDFGILGGYRNNGMPFFLYGNDRSELLNNQARTIPFYGTSTGLTNNITEQSIKNTLLGRLVEKIGII